MSALGWSYPAGCQGVPGDEPAYCEVCGIDDCDCPECPVCDVAGDPACFGTHVAALEQRHEYTVIWDNGHACDVLGTFDTEEEAEAFGAGWLAEAIATDSNPEEAAEDYSYEVQEGVEVPPTKEDILRAMKSPPGRGPESRLL